MVRRKKSKVKSRGGYIVSVDVDRYIEKLFSVDDPIVEEMEEVASSMGIPIVGRQVGRFLEQITLLSGSKRILELGSGIGYSAYWFSRAVGKEGSIVCTDYSEENKRIAFDFFKKAGIKTNIEFKTGDSLKYLSVSTECFDIIFNDIDKELYPYVVEPAYERLRVGGILISDNVLWGGRVIMIRKISQVPKE